MHLHIVSFNIPYPPNYGGIIDVFYKIKALSDAGVKIYLHCFEYGRQHANELQKYCEKVSYYRRNTGFTQFLSCKPYIVNTRISEALIKNLAQDNFPVLFEGLHTTGILLRNKLPEKFKMLRAHNIEHEYYSGLAKSHGSLLRKFYFFSEALKLQNFEKILETTDSILAISDNDHRYFKKYYPGKNISQIPPFHMHQKVSCMPGKGDYILFHGNLSVFENLYAFHFLLKNVLSNIKIKCIIAGKDPSAKLADKIKPFAHITLIANPDEKEMEKLITEAHINILYTHQATGLKLKLLAVLFKGRFCIANDLMIKNTGCENFCAIANTPEAYLQNIKKLMQEDFTETMISERKKALEERYSNQNNARKIISLLTK